MPVPRPRRPLSVADGIFGGVAIALVGVTLYSFARKPFEDWDSHSHGPRSSDQLRVEIRDRRDGTNVDFTVPFGLVQGVASILPDEATVRFDHTVDEVDLADLWKRVEAAPEGERIELEQSGKKIAATRLGKLVEIEVRGNLRRHRYGEPMPPEPPAPPAAPGGSAAVTPEPPGTSAEPAEIAVPEEGESEEVAILRLPVSLLQKAAEGHAHGSTKIRLADTLREVRGLGSIELVKVESENETVRIALE